MRVDIFRSCDLIRLIYMAILRPKSKNKNCEID